MKNNLKYIIVVGFSRTGTTSLYNYLVDHPNISGSKNKELRFFLPLNSTLRLSKGYKDLYEEEYYRSLFPRNNNLFIDASPDYIEDLETFNNISSNLPEGSYKIILIIRNRYERLKSWFDYAKMRGMISYKEDLDGVILRKKDFVSNKAKRLYDQQHSMNFYAKRIKKILSIIPKGDLLIIRNEKLKTDPKNTVNNLVKELQLNETFYENYVYTIFNKSHKKRNQFLMYFLELKNLTRKYYNSLLFRKIGKRLRKIFNTTTEEINLVEASESFTSREASKAYNSFFIEDNKQLKILLDEKNRGFQD